MAGRLKTMPKSLNDSLASSQGAPCSPGSGWSRSKSIADSNQSEVSHGDGVTFASQDRLPKLPIPELKGTCQKYLEVLKPLQSAREHESTKAAVADFLANDGPPLQEQLRKYATGKSSYIEQFWYDSYLNFDNPVVLNLNPFFLLEDDPTPARGDQVTRAASVVISALAFARAIRKEELSPDTLHGAPLDMYQYSRIFGTSRIPTENGCIIGQDPDARHIVVLCRGQFYWFDVLDDRSEMIMTEKDIALNLHVIVDDAVKIPAREAARGALGVLSTENRKTWAGLREVLTREDGSNNADCLAIVDCALFILCLDDTEPATSHDLCMNMLCGTNEIERGVQVGTCTNRWYDKLQIIVCRNGSAGINFEHTGVDGHTVLRMASDVYTDTILRFAQTIHGQAPSLWASSSPDPSMRDPASFGEVSTTPHKLEWDMLPELRTALRFAETRLADLIQQNEFRTLEFVGYGKYFITSMGFSPDAFVQMAFQAAYYGLYGQLECTYEPAMTKIYLHGRTEAIRTVTMECLDFVRTFWGDNPAAQKIDRLRKACQRHTATTKDCAKAQGQDRHLFALQCVWQRGLDADAGGVDSVASSGMMSAVESDDSRPPTATSSSGRKGNRRKNDVLHTTAPRSTPAIFIDPGWAKLNNTILSTSNCGNPSLRHFGFGPTSSEGFGIGYIIKDDSISICASSKHRQTKRFMDGIESYLYEVRRLLRSNQRESASPKASRAREAETQVLKGGRFHRGRAIDTGLLGSRLGIGPGLTLVDDTDSDDDGLGGYGFFDAGMLLQALSGTHFSNLINGPGSSDGRDHADSDEDDGDDGNDDDDDDDGHGNENGT